MGDEKIRYLVKFRGCWRYRPSAAMRGHGFRFIAFGPEITLKEKQRVIALNADWDRIRTGLQVKRPRAPDYPAGSVGDGYLRAIELRKLEREANGVVWTKEQESRDDWPRAWKWLEVAFGDADPRTIEPEMLIKLRAAISTKVSESEAHRVIKVWRALWKKMAVMSYCEKDRDPSLAFENRAPPPRQAVWKHRDVTKMVQRAWRAGYHGLAAVIAVAWDTQLSPVDVRLLTAAQRAQDDQGSVFFLDRAKTGRAAAGTLSRWSEAILEVYLKTLPAAPIGDALLFRNRSGAPYSKDTLGDDFREIRQMVLGPDDDRQLADLRRSGTVEAFAGKADPASVSSKMANTLSASNRLHKTYNPVNVVVVREVDAARTVGRKRLRTKNKTG